MTNNKSISIKKTKQFVYWQVTFEYHNDNFYDK